MAAKHGNSLFATEVSKNTKSLIPVTRKDVAEVGHHPFMTLQREIDRLFDNFTRGFPQLGSGDLVPSTDVTETDKEIEITAELPGLEEKDVQINVAGKVVCAGIHMSDIPTFPYRILWEERQILSVANLTRQDAHEFFTVVEPAGIRTTTRAYPLTMANQALDDLRSGALQCAAVLVP